MAANNVSGAKPYMPSEPSEVCHTRTLFGATGVWTGESPLDFSLSILIIQITIIVLMTRIFELFIRRFHQPRVIAEIIGGIILGPSVLGLSGNLLERLFPYRSLVTLETLSNLGLIFFLFLVGVEMDIMVIKRMGKKAMVIAVVSMVVPFAIGIAFTFLFLHHIHHRVEDGAFLLFIGVALSITAFPVLARILAELKLLNVELGRTAMSAAIMNDMVAWVLLALCSALATPHKSVLASLWVILAGATFVLICFYVVRPAMWWLIHRIPEGEALSDFNLCVILTGVMLASFTTDAIGIHSVFGAFVFGLVIPNGPLCEALIDKLEDFVNGLLLPLFYLISGLKTNIPKLRHGATVGFLITIFFLASAGKVVGIVLITLYYNMPLRDGVALGCLMNTRGLVEMIILNFGRDNKVLDDQSFTVLVLMSVITTAAITPVVMSVHQPARILHNYRRRNLQRSKPDSELRMLVCVHIPRHVTSLINLLEIPNPTKRSPIFVYALHLLELTGRGAALLKPAGATGLDKGDDTLVAFDQFEQRAGGISVQKLSAVSPYSTMHEDVCGIAASKHVSFIVLPFHKQPTVDGGMEDSNPGVRTVNEHVMNQAPCSVGILVDRGLGSGGGSLRGVAGPIHPHFSHHVAVLFFGGPDDREALAYAWRLTEHPSVGLAVVRFLPAAGSPTPPPAGAPDPRVVSVLTSEGRERELDDEYFSEFRLKTLSNESVIYMEKVVSGSEDTVSVIRNMDSIYNMYIVGRGQGDGTVGQLTAGLSEWTDCPELGAIGDLLTSSDFSATVSVLVVQQYVGAMPETPRRGGGGREPIMHALHVGWNGHGGGGHAM